MILMIDQNHSCFQALEITLQKYFENLCRAGFLSLLINPN